jgi:phage/plasmid-associated DNA primase
MIDAELASEYVASCEDLLDAEDKVNQLIHQAGDASVLKDWKHWNPDEIPAVLDLLRLDRLTNGKAIAAALKDWSDRRYAAHKKYGEVMNYAGVEEFLKLPKPDRVDRGSISNWQAYYSAATNL